MEFTEQERAENRERIVAALRATERRGVEDLIAYMDESGFFEAPCSTQYHLSCEGGLAQHSINVLNTIRNMNWALDAAMPDDTLVIIALLHDLGKMGMHGKPNYVENWVKDGRPTKAEPEQKFKRSEAKPYVTNPDLLYLPHAIRSVEIANRFMRLTEEEEFAIACHDGLYGEMKYVVSGHETLLYFLLHTSDMFCSRFLEKEEGGSVDE